MTGLSGQEPTQALRGVFRDRSPPIATPKDHANSTAQTPNRGDGEMLFFLEAIVRWRRFEWIERTTIRR